MSIFQDIVGRFSQTVTAYAGDKALMQAMVSAAANVIVADGEVAGEEFDTALAGMQANPILEKGYDRLMLESELYDGIARARTRAGRAENLRLIAAIATRGADEREATFLIAADVADLDGISDTEDAALDEIAHALALDKATLLRASPVKRKAFPV
ncbi:tellurite resistance TerB family protein [Methylobacterium sp. BTF04]|uniref:tellurite resistance TerB family protein n=1 Tax=Methylobacterium sp. BTF04 TaxID=2708300 RepID=UPI0013D2C5FC|nr:tellurite resistance TerB family protein [Methylobacterium sp. BTF04]NEU11125.1 tellurite resistance TerB family protein [Methylobacterium sp. BTF04]